MAKAKFWKKEKKKTNWATRPSHISLSLSLSHLLWFLLNSLFLRYDVVVWTPSSTTRTCHQEPPPLETQVIGACRVTHRHQPTSNQRRSLPLTTFHCFVYRPTFNGHMGSMVGISMMRRVKPTLESSWLTKKFNGWGFPLRCKSI